LHMHRIPRDMSVKKLVKLLRRYGYEIKRETGSHIRLESNLDSKKHRITIPDHSPIKIGTLNNILNDIAEHFKISKEKLVSELFKK